MESVVVCYVRLVSLPVCSSIYIKWAFVFWKFDILRCIIWIVSSRWKLCAILLVQKEDFMPHSQYTHTHTCLYIVCVSVFENICYYRKEEGGVTTRSEKENKKVRTTKKLGERAKTWSDILKLPTQKLTKKKKNCSQTVSIHDIHIYCECICILWCAEWFTHIDNFCFGSTTCKHSGHLVELPSTLFSLSLAPVNVVH